MKPSLILFIIIFLSCSTKEKNPTESGETTGKTLPDSNSITVLDSISIEDIYADNPFPFEPLSVSNFKNYINKPFEEVAKQIQNIHDSEAIDTLITLKWENSNVVFYKSSYTTKELIDFVDIYDTAFIFKEDIKIGMSLDEVKSKFDIFKNDNKNYKFIEFYFGEATNYTVLFFEDRKLKSVRYMPYTG